MDLRTIMVQLDIDKPVAPRLEFARDLAGRFGAGLIAVAAAEARMPLPSDESGLASSEMFRQGMLGIERRLKVMKEEFMRLAGDEGAAFWRAEMADPTRCLALHARAADLLVTGSPAAADRSRTVDAGTLILAAGRPVLFAAGTLAPLRAERIVVGWKDTREARRAVADAMPFLTSAAEVVVVACSESDGFDARDGSADVARHLTRHGVNARPLVLEVSGSDVAGALVGEALEIGADLVVAGGYGRSRLREWAFGGVTRSLLSDGRLHRLLSN